MKERYERVPNRTPIELTPGQQDRWAVAVWAGAAILAAGAVVGVVYEAASPEHQQLTTVEQDR